MQRLSRRDFAFTATAAAAAVACTHLPAQNTSTTNADIAAIEHDQILASAAAAKSADVPPGFDHLRLAANTIAALTAAFVLTRDDTFATSAATQLRRWLLAPETSPLPGELTSRDAILALIPLAELARASSFLSDTLDPAAAQALLSRLSSARELLHTDPQAKLARDRKDHVASAWLLLSAALARATRDEKRLDATRLLFKKPTIRNQVTPDGHFPNEITTPFPYRNSLFNFDLLGGACQLLTSPFDDLWSYELPDGPGMRSVAAFLNPLIRERQHWSFVSDADHFRDLPGRRPALLFAGRAFRRPEYIDTYKSTPPAPPSAAIADTFPITQPILWTTRAPHGL